MQMAAYVEQNLLYTAKATDLGRGQRSDPVEGLPQYPPGAGRYEIPRDFDDGQNNKGFDFGRNAAHGGVDPRLTSVDDMTYERMVIRREGVIGNGCEKEDKRQEKHQRDPYKGPGHEAIKSSIRPYPYKKPISTGPPKLVQRIQDGPGPGMYDRNLKPGGPSYQFGSRFDDKRSPPRTQPDGTRFESALRAKPHLHPKKMDGPGPGDYKLENSVQTRYRPFGSSQMCTWGTGREQDQSPNKRKQEFHQPGPAEYSHVYNDQRQFTKPHQNEGFAFSQSMRDIQRPADLSKDPPGAGSYNPELPKSGTSKSFAGGPERKGDKPNGVPAPGAHSPQYPPEAPSWGFNKPTVLKPDKNEWQANLGPGTHNPVHVTHTHLSAPFSMTAKSGKGPAVDDGTDLAKKIRAVQSKKREQVQFMGVPGPQYNIPGDFDFPDPRNPDDVNAPGKKKAKFAFGMKFNTRAKNLDMPGPGEYETDVIPMNHKNPAYWIGTDVRKDLGVPYAYMYPGPDHYFPEEAVQGSQVSFPKDRKNTTIEKTNDPGPASYANYGTVGVIPRHDRNEANARVVQLPPKKSED